VLIICCYCYPFILGEKGDNYNLIVEHIRQNSSLLMGHNRYKIMYVSNDKASNYAQLISHYQPSYITQVCAPGKYLGMSRDNDEQIRRR
jgi:hypothetical protein